MKITLEQLADLAYESEITDPIDWDYLMIEERNAYMLMASHVLEMMDDVSQEERLVVCMASLTKLLVENFILNMKLENRNGGIH
jgi:hypothetical protein